MNESQAFKKELTETLTPFYTELIAQRNTISPLALRLTSQSLLLLSAAWENPPAPLVILTPDHGQLQTATAWAELLGGKQQWHEIFGPLTTPEIEGTVITATSRAWHELLATWGNLNTAFRFLVAPDAFSAFVPEPQAYAALHTNLTTGETQAGGLSLLVKQLVNAGYTRYEKSLEPGGIRVRGESIDIAPVSSTGTYTIIFLGDTVESIVHTLGQRSKTIDRIRIAPARFPTETAPAATLLKPFIVLRPNAYSELNGHSTFVTDALHPAMNFPYHETTEPLKTKKQYVLYENADRVRAYFTNKNVQPILCPSALAATPLHLTSTSSTIISEQSLLPPAATSEKVSTPGVARQYIGELTVGRPAVHSNHGIGIYEGLQTRTIDTQSREYLVLRYAEGDVLSVPVELAHKVTPYIGEKAPTLHRLGGVGWSKARRKAKGDAVALAKELLTIARKRSGVTRPSYRITPALEQAMSETFPYELTPDQARTWQDVRNDLTGPRPADRVVVGDVGFGKTEIAERAAWVACDNDRQVAVIAPTTLLVQQHADTFRQRLQHLQGRIGVLSRFVSAGKQKQVREDIKTGKAALVIGTHALLSKALQWKNLDMVIIDEEQRFGVKQKEHFKTIRAATDIFSLSATPIPRTLSMALGGLRDLSLIATPPEGRKSVITHVALQNDSLVRKALMQELTRHGQVYVVNPKVMGLASLARYIEQLVPKARVAVAHGQMDDSSLANVMGQFDRQEIDILVSSTIIENGLDLPSANTLIVFGAPHFGLSDLYQLRGRVGRREVQGFAYFLYNQNQLTPIQRARLTAITEATRLGSGWELAQRDLEIRGAGNLLGAEQSGSVQAVGLQLYLDLVHEAVEEARNGVAHRDVDIQLPVTSALPAHYMNDVKERTRWYIRLSRSTSRDELDQQRAQLTASYGPLPPETDSLLNLLHLQHAAAAAGILKITSQHIAPSDESPYERLEIEAANAPEVLARLNTIGQWRYAHGSLIHFINEITPAFVERLTAALC